MYTHIETADSLTGVRPSSKAFYKYNVAVCSQGIKDYKKLWV